MLGYALDALREACFGAHSARLILLDYEALTRAPGVVMTRLYTLLDEPIFEHDFEHVAYETDAFDAALGAPGLHEVRGRGNGARARPCCRRTCSSGSPMTASGTSRSRAWPTSRPSSGAAVISPRAGKGLS